MDRAVEMAALLKKKAQAELDKNAAGWGRHFLEMAGHTLRKPE